MSRKIKNYDLNQGKYVARPTSETVGHPVIFSLQHIQAGKFCFSILDHKQKGDFADALYRRKDFTWNDLYQNDHKKLGVESLPADRIKASKPTFMTEDVDKYEVIRFSKEDGRVVGFRKSNVFYILWIDCKFKLYNH